MVTYQSLPHNGVKRSDRLKKKAVKTLHFLIIVLHNVVANVLYITTMF